MAKRSLLTALVLASFAASAATASASPGVAAEPSDNAFHDGFRTSMTLPATARIAAGGGTEPGQVPATVGLDLLLGPALPDAALAKQLKSTKPLRTDDLMPTIAGTTSVSTGFKTLRDNIISKWCAHTGLVVGIESVTTGKTTTQYLRTIEGNTSTLLKDADGKTREGVATKLRPLDSWISGYVSLG